MLVSYLTVGILINVKKLLCIPLCHHKNLIFDKYAGLFKHLGSVNFEHIEFDKAVGSGEEAVQKQNMLSLWRILCGFGWVCLGRIGYTEDGVNYERGRRWIGIMFGPASFYFSFFDLTLLLQFGVHFDSAPCAPSQRHVMS